MVSKKLGRAYQPPVPAGEIKIWGGYPPSDAGVMPLKGESFNPDHFPDLLAIHGDGTLPDRPSVDSFHEVIGHGRQGEIQVVNNLTAVSFDETVHDFGETIKGFVVSGTSILAWGVQGKAWGSIEGASFISLVQYCGSGNPGDSSAYYDVSHAYAAGDVFVVIYGDYYIGISRDKMQTWFTLPIKFGLFDGITSRPMGLAADGKGNWIAAGQYHQFAMSNDDWVTLTTTDAYDGSNSAELTIPGGSSYLYSTAYPFVFCDNNGVFYAGSYGSKVYRSIDQLNSWDPLTSGENDFNVVRSNNSYLSYMVDLGDDNLVVGYDSDCSRSYDGGDGWVKQADNLGGSAPIKKIISDDKGFVITTLYHASGAKILTSTDRGDTFDSGIVHMVHYLYSMHYFNDSWYALSSDLKKIMKSNKGYSRNEWEIKP
ncbi:MAG: hypothetical protein HRT38_02695 [Alteromonadaceae bacterium]|nr:hypothetical protein [Alteromonadaceae bacterium]